MPRRSLKELTYLLRAVDQDNPYYALLRRCHQVRRDIDVLEVERAILRSEEAGDGAVQVEARRWTALDHGAPPTVDAPTVRDVLARWHEAGVAPDIQNVEGMILMEMVRQNVNQMTRYDLERLAQATTGHAVSDEIQLWLETHDLLMNDDNVDPFGLV